MSHLNGDGQSRRISRKPVACALALFLALRIGSNGLGATYEIWQPGLVQFGNSWLFNSNENGAAYQMQWQVLSTRTVGGRTTTLLFEDSRPFWTYTRDVYLDSGALGLVQSILATSSPVRHLKIDFSSNPLEWFPRFVYSTDASREFGQGYATLSYQEVTTPTWVRSQTQKVSFLSTGTIDLRFGALTVPFDVVQFRIEESWRYTDNYSGVRARTILMSRTVGPLEMVETEENYYPTGGLYFRRTASHAIRTIASLQPELIPQRVTFNPPQVSAGDTFAIQWRELCLLNPTLRTHSASIRLSTDTVITAKDTPIATATIPILAANSSNEFSTTAAIPLTLIGGSYYVGVLLDPAGQIQEMDDGNNGAASTGRLAVAGKADLSVGSVAFSPTMLAPGATLNVTGVIRNIGGATAPPCWVHAYLSTDTVISARDYPLITGVQTGDLAPQAQFNFNRNGVVPSWFSSGNYYVGLVADVLNDVVELSEANNSAHAGQLLSVAMPDLQVTGGSVAPTAVWAGAGIYVQATIQNTGLQTAPASWARLYLSADSVITTGDIPLMASVHLSALNPGMSTTIYGNPTLPAVSAGYYYVGAYCDVAGEVAESNETNNGGVVGAPLLIKTAPPDLRPIHFDVRPKAVYRSYSTQTITLALSGFIINAGGAPTTRPAVVEFRASPNADLSPPVYPLCNPTTVPLLGIGDRYGLATLNRTLSPAAVLPPGVYTVAVSVDVLNDVAESDETNNRLAAVGQLYINRTPPKGPAAVGRWEKYR
ncbi:MAG: hypothetical protein N3D11_11205 [Candidatus Sumerlaeia bacterium]|nr:hypothetical protein [Candidatus Sumerlaeia bacterium]